MPIPDHVRLTIDFDLRASPIAGVVRDARGHAESFAGWMALTRTIERALEVTTHAEQDIVADAPAPPSSANGSPRPQVPGEYRP
ncbi:MAG TPA: hypothetical protein VMA73_16530 [Streptosporangiaceae bacterium]|nr:hypothetical protein [Streptosporangiaceae bacterium]